MNTTDTKSTSLIPPALYFPQYRNFWLGMFCAVGGFQVLMFGQFWLIHELTGSPLYLGYIGMANAIPAIVLNLIGGVVADKADKRRLIVITELLSASLVIVLGILTLMHVVRVWHVMVIAVFAGAINAFNQPARQALFPHLVDRRVLTSAVALNSLVWSSLRIMAPAIAGMLIYALGTSSSFLFAGAGMVTFALIVNRLKVPKAEHTPSGTSMEDLLQGLRFIRDHSIFSFLIIMTFFNSFFGLAYMNQMPVFARDILKIGVEGQGVLLSVNGIGSMIMTVWVGFKGNFRHMGAVLIGGAALSGLSVAGFALGSQYTGSYPLAAVFMFATGVFSSASYISTMSALQMMVPDRMRGRVMGFFGMTWNIMPLGGMYAGALAEITGAPYAIAIGGVLVTAFALGAAIFNRQVLHLGTDTPA
ncbi:MAG TPA: MFS transporter [Desulfobacteraceae bacterium]|nr:MFS transporter [Desulfobacteraceae bacterium]